MILACDELKEKNQQNVSGKIEKVRGSGGINSKPYWSLLAEPHVKGFNEASASK